jgi:uncharacterized protein DUF3352
MTMTDDLDKTTISPQGTYDPEGTYEPAPDAAPADSVLPPDPASRGARRRWAIAVAVIAMVVVASAFAFSLFTGRAPDALVLGYVPEDSIMYGEIRMDLPGDQRANIGAFLSKFPGFADQSTIETKIDEVLDRLVGEASSGSQTFSQDVKPWFGGQLAFSVGALPNPDDVTTDPSALNDARFLVLVSVKDEALARSWFDAAIAETGTAATAESYGGATLNVVDGQGAYAILGGKVAVIGDVASVRAAVDTNGTSGFATKPEPQAALAATTGDHVGFAYIALRPLLDWSSRLAESGVAGTLPSEALLGMVPDWAAFALRVEGDALLMEAISPKPSTQSADIANRTSAVADHVPSKAIALSVSHDYGRGLLQILETYRSEPALAEVVDAIDQGIGFLGGPDAAVGWIGDFGITVTRTDDAIEGGLIITPTDSAAAGRLFTSLRTLASLGGASMGITVRDESYAGTTITIVDLGDLNGLAGQAGLPTDVLGADVPAGHVELAYAVTDQVVILGSGPGFVRSVLDTTPGSSLTSTDRYKSVVDRAGPGSGVSFADVTAIRELFETALTANEPAEVAAYEQEIKPFLVPFDVIFATTSVDGDLNHSTTIVTVK